MPTVTWDHVHLRSPDPETTAKWLEDILGGEIVRGPGRIDVRLGGANVFIAPVAAGDGVNSAPVTPYQGLDHFGLSVRDIDAVAAEIRAKGVEFTKEPTTIRPGAKIAMKSSAHRVATFRPAGCPWAPPAARALPAWSQRAPPPCSA